MPEPTTDEMAREVYEAITGKCVHEGKPYGADEPWKCVKCDESVYLFGMGRDFEDEHFPWLKLATSIDAWAKHIWPVMTDEQTKSHDWILTRDYVEHGHIKYIWLATAIHHLTAAYNVDKGGK